MSVNVRTFRHDTILTHRPYGVDVDADGWLWEGCGRNRLMGHRLGTGEIRDLVIPEMDGHVVYQVLAWQSRLVLTLGEAPFFLVYDAQTGKAQRCAIPSLHPIVWYGVKAGPHKVILYDRSESTALLLDAPEAQPRMIPCPYDGQLASGWYAEDGLVYSAVYDPARLVRFDPVAERFLDEIPVPDTDATLTGLYQHGGILYFWSTSGGYFLPFDTTSGQWGARISAPDYRQVYGFMGGGFTCGGKGYLCLSTYQHASKLDPKTGKIIIPDGPLTIDGKPPRFLDRLLVFDAETRSFDYLVAPAQSDGVPLLCYHWTDGVRFVVTGIVIPYGVDGMLGEHYGSWLVLEVGF